MTTSLHSSALSFLSGLSDSLISKFSSSSSSTAFSRSSFVSELKVIFSHLPNHELRQYLLDNFPAMSAIVWERFHDHQEASLIRREHAAAATGEEKGKKRKQVLLKEQDYAEVLSAPSPDYLSVSLPLSSPLFVIGDYLSHLCLSCDLAEAQSAMSAVNTQISGHSMKALVAELAGMREFIHRAFTAPRVDFSPSLSLSSFLSCFLTRIRLRLATATDKTNILASFYRTHLSALLAYQLALIGATDAAARLGRCVREAAASMALLATDTGRQFTQTIGTIQTAAHLLALFQSSSSSPTALLTSSHYLLPANFPIALDRLLIAPIDRLVEASKQRAIKHNPQDVHDYEEAIIRVVLLLRECHNSALPMATRGGLARLADALRFDVDGASKVANAVNETAMLKIVKDPAVDCSGLRSALASLTGFIESASDVVVVSGAAAHSGDQHKEADNLATLSNDNLFFVDSEGAAAAEGPELSDRIGSMIGDLGKQNKKKNTIKQRKIAQKQDQEDNEEVDGEDADGHNEDDGDAAGEDDKYVESPAESEDDVEVAEAVAPATNKKRKTAIAEKKAASATPAPAKKAAKTTGKKK